MQSMNISLPDPMKQFVDGQISTGRYSSASEYVRELIRADEKRKAEESWKPSSWKASTAPKAISPRRTGAQSAREALARVQARTKKPG